MEVWKLLIRTIHHVRLKLSILCSSQPQSEVHFAKRAMSDLLSADEYSDLPPGLC